MYSRLLTRLSTFNSNWNYQAGSLSYRGPVSYHRPETILCITWIPKLSTKTCGESVSRALPTSKILIEVVCQAVFEVIRAIYPIEHKPKAE